MFWIFLLLLFVGFVFFKLGVYAVLLGVLEMLLKIVLLVTGGFILYAVWKRIARRRRVLTLGSATLPANERKEP